MNLKEYKAKQTEKETETIKREAKRITAEMWKKGFSLGQIQLLGDEIIQYAEKLINGNQIANDLTTRK